MGRHSFWRKPEGGRREVRQFAWAMAISVGLAGCLVWYRGNVQTAQGLGGIAVLFLLCGLLLPAGLKPVYVVWMYVARVLGWISMHVLVGLVFYTLFTPVGLAMRLLQYDPLYRKLERDRESYWARRGELQPSRQQYDRQF